MEFSGEAKRYRQNQTRIADNPEKKIRKTLRFGNLTENWVLSPHGVRVSRLAYRMFS